MSSHYGVALIPDAHKNAINVVYALWKNENPALSENLSQPANASGSPSDPVDFWFGGRSYSDTDLMTIQDLANQMPSGNWPIMGVSGAVSLLQAQTAVAVMILSVTTRAEFTTQQAQDTLNALLGALAVSRVNYDD